MKTLSKVVVSLIVCSVLGLTACRRGEAVDEHAGRPGAFDPCVMALAPHQGTGDIDAGIARVQQRARDASHPVPELTALAEQFIAGARASQVSHDNGQVVGMARFAGDDRAWGWRQDGDTVVLARRLLRFSGHAAPTLSGNMLAPYFPTETARFERTRVVVNGVAQPILNPTMGNSEIGVYGTDVNEGGLAVGFVIDVAGAPGGPFAVLWQNGATTMLDRAGAPASWAGAVNDQGVIAGGVRRAGDGNFKPVIWRNGVPLALSALDGIAHHVNNAGMVFGQFQPAVNKAFLWENGTITDPCPSLPQCTGMHLNEAGQALVRSGDRSYVFDHGVLTDIGVLGPGVGTYAHTMIDNGAVVGYSSPDGSYADSRAVAYLGGMLRDLNDLLPPGAGWTRLIDAIAVNSHGRIVGIGIKDGVPKAFLMTPIP